MKMKSIGAEIYECRLDPYRIVIRRVDSMTRQGRYSRRWRPTIYVTNSYRWGVRGYSFKTLDEAKRATAKEWIGLRLTAIKESIFPNDLPADVQSMIGVFMRDSNPIWYGKDPMTPALLDDILAENGFGFLVTKWIVEPGCKAGLIWPANFEIIVNRHLTTSGNSKKKA